MFQKLGSALRKVRSNKKGQSIMELAIGTILVGVLLTAMVDFGLIIQTKTETMMMARNGTRYMISLGIDPVNGGNNEVVRRKVESNVRGLFTLNHPQKSGRKFVALGNVTVMNTHNFNGRHAQPIQNKNTGKNPVYVEVCEVIYPITRPIFGTSRTICSGYGSFHSSQYKN